jgi:putative peptidoglycan lipid II flippase
MTQSQANIPHDPGRALTGNQIARAATIIMLALVVSGILGLIRQSVIAAAFGAGRDLDAFYAALRVPETLFVLVAGGALGSAFIPVFERFLADDDFDGAWRLASAALSIVAAAATLLSITAFILADPIVENLLVPGADASSQALTAELMRMMLATVVIFGISGLVMGILNGYQHFLAPAFAPSMYNLGLIFGAVLLAPSMGVQGLAWGAVIGAGLHLLIQIPVLLRLDFARLRLSFDYRGDGVGEVLLLMGPRVLGLGVVQVNFWVNAALTSDMSPGSLTALATAFTLMFTVLGILGQSIGTAVFPTLARLHAEKDDTAFDRTLTSALSGVLFLSIPAGIGMAVLANPIVTVLFERDEWTSTDTAGTAWALGLFGVGLAGHAALEVLARAFYALHDTWTPVKIGGATMILNIVLSLILIRVLGYPGQTDFARGPFGGLALAMSIATAIESTILWIILRRRVTLNDVPVLISALKTFVAALIMASMVGAWLMVSDDLPALPQLLVGMVIGVVGFWGVARAFRVEEAYTVPQTVLGRLSRR